MSSIRDASDKKLKISCSFDYFTSMWSKYISNKRLYTSNVISNGNREEFYFGKFTARVFSITIAYADIGSLKSKVSPYIIW